MFLTDGGIETSLIFDDHIELPHFAAFTLLRYATGRLALTRYFERYIAVARQARFGFVLESATWRASSDWAVRLGFTKAQLAEANYEAVGLLDKLRRRHQTADTPMLVSGCVGPRGDGYIPGALMTAEEARGYHDQQIDVLVQAGCDLVTAITMTNTPEAIGVARAAAARRVPAVISFTVETDGRLPTGQPLGEAIAELDAEAGTPPAYYMVNCAHPLHVMPALARDGAWTLRIGGLRANASLKSHAELNEAAELDRGDPAALADAHRDLLARLSGVRVLGGCCGTDHRHVAALAATLQPVAS